MPGTCVCPFCGSAGRVTRLLARTAFPEVYIAGPLLPEIVRADRVWSAGVSAGWPKLGKGIAVRPSKRRKRWLPSHSYPFSEGGFDSTGRAVLSEAAVKRGRLLPPFSCRLRPSSPAHPYPDANLPRPKFKPI